MTTRFWRLAAVAALIVGAACSGDDGGTTDTSTDSSEPSTEAPDTAASDTAAPDTGVPATEVPDSTVVIGGEHVVQFVGCEQWSLFQKFDPANAEGRVPADAELLLDENGWATYAHLAHSCDDFVVDDTSTGPTLMDVEWVAVSGPAEQRELPEFAGYAVQPTQYWEQVLFNTDNQVLVDLMADIGVTALLMDEMTYRSYLDPPPDPPEGAGQGQEGSAQAADPSVDYRWASMGNVPVVDVALVFVHLVHGVTPDGTTFWQDVVCPGHLRLSEDQGMMLLDLRSDGVGEPGEPVQASSVWDQEAAPETALGAAYTIEVDDTCTVTFSAG